MRLWRICGLSSNPRSDLHDIERRLAFRSWCNVGGGRVEPSASAPQLAAADSLHRARARAAHGAAEASGSRSSACAPPFEVVAREEDRTASLGGLELRLRLDRVDRLRGGDEMLIDYKSGASSLADWFRRTSRRAAASALCHHAATSARGARFRARRAR